MALIPRRKMDGEYTTWRRVRWVDVTENDTCEELVVAGYNEATFEVSGSFGSGSIILEGSVLGDDYYQLNDIDNNPIEITAGGMVVVKEAVYFIRPSPQGSGITVTCGILVKG